MAQLSSFGTELYLSFASGSNLGARVDNDISHCFIASRRLALQDEAYTSNFSATLAKGLISAYDV